jgi:4-hydroxy-L-threonine phosphate dehydrogenase PdxA
MNSRRPTVGLNPAGTAFDIDGRGIADELSMVEAIKLAAKTAEVKMTSKR